MTATTYSKRFQLTAPPRASNFLEVDVLEGPDDSTPENSLVLIDTQPVTASTDPTAPTEFAFDVDTCQLEDGSYWFRYRTAGGAITSLVGPVRDSQAGGEPVDGLPNAPSLEEVRLLMMAVVADEDDNRLEIFDDSSTPTANEVFGFIRTIRLEVYTRILVPIPPRFAESARSVVAQGVVSQILMSVHQESLADTDSSYAQARATYLARLGDLTRAVRDSDYPLVR